MREQDKVPPLYYHIREQPTWIQQFGGNLASRVLWFVCGFAGLFLVAWWFTRPSVADVRALLDFGAREREKTEREGEE